MMKFLTIALFIVSVLLLFILHYFLMQDGLHYFEAFLFVLIASFFVGYIFVTLLFEPLSKQNERLKDLVRENLHEINLPIATIDINVQMLQKSANEKSKKRLKRIKQALKRLQRQYELLSYEIKKEFSQIQKEVFSIKELINDRLSYFQELGRNPFIIEVEDRKLYLDKIGFEQVFDNLLENAIKYSLKDEPIKITFKNSCLSIEDKGKGISEDALVQVFNRYFQEESSFKGEGIGLFIVKRYCDKEGIELKIYTKKGSGTKIELHFSKLHIIRA